MRTIILIFVSLFLQIFLLFLLSFNFELVIVQNGIIMCNRSKTEKNMQLYALFFLHVHRILRFPFRFFVDYAMHICSAHDYIWFLDEMQNNVISIIMWKQYAFYKFQKCIEKKTFCSSLIALFQVHSLISSSRCKQTGIRNICYLKCRYMTILSRINRHGK